MLSLVACGLLPSTAESVQLVTGPPDGFNGCFSANTAGRLVVDPKYGTAIVGDGHVSMIPPGAVPLTVAWRPGFTARRSGSEVEVFDRQGFTVAITGRSYRLEGGGVSAGGSSGLKWPELRTSVFWACGSVDPLTDSVPPASQASDATAP
jgi:hypothetical protein